LHFDYECQDERERERERAAATTATTTATTRRERERKKKATMKISKQICAQIRVLPHGLGVWRGSLGEWLHANMICISNVHNGHVLAIGEWSASSLLVVGYEGRLVSRVDMQVETWMPARGVVYEATNGKPGLSHTIYTLPHSIVWVDGIHLETSLAILVDKFRYEDGRFLIAARVA
jgi:hypothetical protein